MIIMAKQATNRFLHKAKTAKNDEFYTQYPDIQKEIEAFEPQSVRAETGIGADGAVAH